jgi:hypothetical protein
MCFVSVQSERFNFIIKAMKIKTPVLILMLASAIFISIPLVSISKSIKLTKHGVFTESTVVARSTKSKGLSHVTVSFILKDGIPVNAKATKRYYVSVGDKVMIYYDPADPLKIDFGDTIGYNMRGVYAGGFLFLISLFFLIRQLKADNLKKQLIQSGMKIAAEFVSVSRNDKYRMGDKNPWVINCRWTDKRNEKEYYFQSKDYTIDPGPYLEGKTHIEIYIDPADPGKYFMNNSFIPEGDNTFN